jgi:hypothetical protein
MSVNKDFFRRRDFNYDFQQSGPPGVGWADADRLDVSALIEQARADLNRVGAAQPCQEAWVL